MLENRDLTWRDQQWDHWRPVEVHSDKDMQIPLRFHAVSLNDRPNRFVVPEWPVLSGPPAAFVLKIKEERTLWCRRPRAPPQQAATPRLQMRLPCRTASPPFRMCERRGSDRA